MKELASNRLYKFPFKDYTYISDVIDVEGPLLVHYMNGERHALYYWVEGDNEFNRWLCFEITLPDFYNFLHKHISLFEIIEKKDNEAFYTVDIDKDLKYSNFQMIQGYALPDEYKPDVSSFYLDEIAPVYEEMFKKGEKNLYKTVLREKSVDLVISSSNSAYGRTNSLRECRDFLIGIDNSVTYFNQYHSFNLFKKKTSDMDKLKKMVHAFVSSSELRVANVSQNSFHISLAPDLSIRNDSFDKLRQELNEKFIEDVLRIDYNNQEDIDYIKKKYEDEPRKKIFEPFIKVVNNPNFNLTFIDKKTNKTKNYDRVSQYNKKLIIPKIEEHVVETEPNKVFITLTLEVDENTDLLSLSKKDLQQGTLFSTISDHAEQDIQRFDLNRHVVIFNKPIKLKYSHDGNESVISFEPLNISVKHAVRNTAFDKFIEELDRILEEDYLAKTPKHPKNKKYFDDNILDVKDKTSA